ncbi:MAG: TRAP transporter small permease [Oscillospiraceae bacterium]|nr:TRAP transporter small permease [Oscillospiraceae bacterium]
MKKFLAIYRKIDDALEVIIKWFCAILLFAMICVCFVNTVGRYAFHHSYRGAEEIVIFCAVWVTCVGASLTAREDDHVTLDLVQELVKNNKVKAVLYAVTRTLACFFLIALLPAAFEMLRIYAPARSTGTRLPLWVLYASYPIGSVAMVLGYLRITPGRVKALWTGTVEKTEFEKINEGEVTE